MIKFHQGNGFIGLGYRQVQDLLSQSFIRIYFSHQAQALSTESFITLNLHQSRGLSRQSVIILMAYQPIVLLGKTLIGERFFGREFIRLEVIKQKDIFTNALSG